MSRQYDDFVTETPQALCKSSQHDFLVLEDMLTSKKSPLEDKYDMVCFHATQAVEKMLKAYIREKDIDFKVPKIHNLVKLQKINSGFDGDFEKIEENCKFLNDYTAGSRYDVDDILRKDEVVKVLDCTAEAYEFGLLKGVREKLGKEKGFDVLPEHFARGLADLFAGRKMEELEKKEGISCYNFIGKISRDIRKSCTTGQDMSIMEEELLDSGKWGKLERFEVLDRNSGKKVHVLQRQTYISGGLEGSLYDRWYFMGKFNAASGIEFVKQYDEEKGKNRNCKNDYNGGLKR